MLSNDISAKPKAQPPIPPPGGETMKVGRIALSLLAAAILLALALLPIDLSQFFFSKAELGTYQTFTMFAVIPVTFIAIALLLSLSVRLSQPSPSHSEAPHPGGAARQGSAFRPTRPAVAVFLLTLLLLFKALQNLYWLLVWDNTYDPLGIFWLAIPIVGLTGILLAVLLRDGKDSPGCWFTFIGAALLIGVYLLAQLADSHQLTDVRAGRVTRAIERYYNQYGSYPDSLDQISPWYSPLPGPVRIFGQSWCYQPGPGYYRLGYVDREHWSDPRLIGRIARTAGQLPASPSDLPPLCAAEVAALQAQDPGYPYTYWKESH